MIALSLLVGVWLLYAPSVLCQVNKVWLKWGGITVPLTISKRGINICTMVVLSVDGTADNRPVYGKDHEKVWINLGGDTGKRIIRDADPKTFMLLHRCLGPRSCYAKDKEHIFYGYKIIKGADINSFKVLDHQHAQDKEKKYFKENPDGEL